MSTFKLLLFCITCVNSWLSTAQESANTPVDITKTVHWIVVKTKVNICKESKKVCCSIKPWREKVYSNRIADYNKTSLKHRNKHRLAVGPFDSINDANSALELYDLENHTNKTMEKLISNLPKNSDSCYWFLLLINFCGILLILVSITISLFFI